MAVLFGTKTRGCFGVYGIDLSDKSAVTLAIGGSQDSSAGDNGRWCIGINVNARENAAILPCFNQQAYLYAFGHDAVQSNFSVTFLCASISSSGSAGNQVPSALKAYAAARASKSNALSSLIMYGNTLASGAILGCSVSTASVEMKLTNVTFTMALLELQGSSAGSKSGSIAAEANRSLAGANGVDLSAMASIATASNVPISSGGRIA